jgi:hypothetical protein
MRRLSRVVMASITGLGIAWIAWAIASPFLPPLGIVTAAALVGAALAALHVTADIAERRGWIYYRRRQGSWGAVGAAMAEAQAIYRPGQHHVRQVKERFDVDRDEDEEGDGPAPLNRA